MALSTTAKVRARANLRRGDMEVEKEPAKVTPAPETKIEEEKEG